MIMKNKTTSNPKRSLDSTGPSDSNGSLISTEETGQKSEQDALNERFQDEIPDLSGAKIKSILALPRQLRCEIWKRVGYKYFTELRLTCTKVNNDVDNHVGISAVINWNDDSFEFYEDIGIRRAIVVNLSNPKVTDFLLHPELLVELSIHGPISSAYFWYFMKSSENIHRLSIVFNKQMLKMRPGLFPQSSLSVCLPKCTAIRFVSHTKKEKDLIYICDTITGLIKYTLESSSNGMTDIHFSLMHICPSPYLEELVLEVVGFAHKNSKTLQQFHLNIKEREINNKAAQEALQEVEDEEGYKRRDTGAVTNQSSEFSELSEVAQAAHFAQDDKNSAIMIDAERYVHNMIWTSLPVLKKVYISVNRRTLDHLRGMLMKSPHLSSLQLELNGGVLRNSWIDYRQIIETIYKTLTTIKLVGVSFQDKNQKALDIDFLAFNKCICLKKLYLSCIQKEVNLLSKARNVSKLPKTIEDFEIGWLTITAWQWFRLLYCFQKLDTISIAYSTTSDSNFGRLLTIIRWLITFRMTKVQLITITDLKIKFRNMRTIVKKLEKAVPINIEYLDLEDTLLKIDRGQGKKSQLSIPSIESE